MFSKKNSRFKGKRSRSFTGAITYKCTSESDDKPPQHGSQIISPSDICNQLKDELPLKFIVTQGTYGENPVSTFSENEELTAHFVQSLEYASFRTDAGELLRIPVNSSVSAAAIYNPRNELSQALNGYVFPSPSKLMMQSVFPKFVAVVQEHVEEDPEFTVEVNDILFIVSKTKKKTLKCIHVATGLTKFIREESNEVRLSTRPEQILVPLRTLMQYARDQMQVLVSLSKLVPHNDPIREIVGVLAPGTKKCCNLLCTRAAFRSKHQTNFFCAIPESLDLDLQLVSSSNEEHEALCTKTAESFQQFDLAEVNYENLCHLGSKDEHNRMLQLAFYNSTLHSERDNSISLPNRPRKYLPLPRNLSAGKLPQASTSSIENRVALLEETMQTLFCEIKLLNEKLDRVVIQRPNQEIQDDTGIAQAAFDMAIGIQKAVSDLQRNEEIMMMKLNTLREPLKNAGSEQVTKLKSASSFAGDYQSLVPRKSLEDSTAHVVANVKPAPAKASVSRSSIGDTYTISSLNQQYLTTLTIHQVGEVLASLKMNEHIQNFRIHGVDGKKLAGFKRLDLLKLRITDETHRNKLLQLITGEMSAFPLITI